MSKVPINTHASMAKQVSAEVEPRMLLVHFIREQLGLTGTHIGCDTTSCGACTDPLERPAGQILHRLRGAGGRRHDSHRREPGTEQSAPPDPGGVLAGARAPVRLLHTRHDDDRRRAARGEPEPDRARDSSGDLRQSLPLHRLRQHRQIDSIRRREDAPASSTPAEPVAVGGE